MLSYKMSIAFWCVLVACLLPYVWAVVQKSTPNYNNAVPRAPLETEVGPRTRANWAQLNSWEALTPFVAAVIIASLTRGQQSSIDIAAMAFIVFRVAYGVAYIGDRPKVRSLCWLLGMLCVLFLFLTAAGLF